jgi:hypothetical protein
MTTNPENKKCLQGIPVHDDKAKALGNPFACRLNVLKKFFHALDKDDL